MSGPARLGVVLAGGRATRMGGDKAGVLLGGRTLLERAVEIVRAAGLEARVCARATTPLPPVPGLDFDAIWREPADEGRADAPHPLAGLAHAAAAAGEPVVALPVDLPLLPAAVIRGLAAGPRVGTRPAVLAADGRPAALVTRVGPAHAAALAAAAARGAPTLRTLVSLGAELIELVDLDPTADAVRALTNVNHPDDLARVERLLADDG